MGRQLLSVTTDKYFVMSVVIETTQGDLTVDLFLKDRPKTCMNFLKLCKTKAYNLNLFHTVQSDFIAQTGDPSGTGRGGESIFCQLYGEQAKYYEAETIPRIKHSKQGLVSMVNCGENVLGSQFFITLGTNLDSLDGEHCVFGEVVEGEEVINKLNNTITDTEGRPYQDIRITHTVVLHDPYDDPPGLQLRENSPEPSAEMLASTRIGADENINDFEGRTEEEINEILADKEAKARATILEMVGDLPDAEVAPPENVLFVCKLNPVTADEDLEIIFSRFGKVESCEVIRDQKTGDSLQYAFVEFDCPEACERAYFKMDNVLIDDRRIHVDFSQSVSKYKWKGKGRLEILDGKDDSGVNDLIKKERAEIKVSKDGRIDRDMNNLKTENQERKGRNDNRRNDFQKGSRNRSRSNNRKRERSKDRNRRRDSRDRARDRSRSRERRRDRSRSRKRRDRSRDRRRSRSRDRDYRRSKDDRRRSRSKERKSKKHQRRSSSSD